MRAGGLHPAVAQEDHPVGEADRGQAIGDHHQGGRELAPESAQDLGFDRGVHRAGRIVQDQQPWLAHQRPGQRHPLTFAARQREPALADDRVVALRQRTDEPIARRDRGGVDHLVVIGAGVEGDVGSNAVGEQEALLEDHGHGRTQRRDVHLAQVDATDLDVAGVGVDEANHQLGEGALADARGADDRHRLPGQHLEVHAFQHRHGGVVLQAEIVDVQVEGAVRAGRCPARAGVTVTGSRRTSSMRSYPTTARGSSARIHPMNRIGQDNSWKSAMKPISSPSVICAAGHARRADREQQDDRHRGQRIERRLEGGSDRAASHPGLAQGVGLFVQPAGLGVLAPQGLHHEGAVDRFVGHSADVTDALLRESGPALPSAGRRSGS